AGYLASTNELMSLHVSEETRPAPPMAPEVPHRPAPLQKAHEPRPRPAPVGAARPVGRLSRAASLAFMACSLSQIVTIMAFPALRSANQYTARSPSSWRMLGLTCSRPRAIHCLSSSAAT